MYTCVSVYPSPRGAGSRDTSRAARRSKPPARRGRRAPPAQARRALARQARLGVRPVWPLPPRGAGAAGSGALGVGAG
eukprot:9305974-Lingulodinium_polyedra.AAC.1